MKKRFNVFLALMFSVMLLLPMAAEAKVVERMTAQISDDIIITVNGERVPFKAAVVNGRSYLPVRVIGYALNSEVNWVQSRRQITLDTKEKILPKQEFSDLVSIKSGKIRADRRDDMNLYLNNKYYADISQQIIVIEDRSYLPIRAISENLGIRSTWNQETNTIEIVNPKTVDIADIDKPYYVEDLPVIEKQEDYLVGNWKGHDTLILDNLDYRLDSALYVSTNDDGTYDIVDRNTVNDPYNTEHNGMSFVIKTYNCKFDSYDNTLSRGDSNSEILENDFDFNITQAEAPLYLNGEVLSADYGDNTDARYQRF